MAPVELDSMRMGQVENEAQPVISCKLCRPVRLDGVTPHGNVDHGLRPRRQAGPGLFNVHGKGHRLYVAEDRFKPQGQYRIDRAQRTGGRQKYLITGLQIERRKRHGDSRRS